MKARIIRTKMDYEAALARIEKLMIRALVAGLRIPAELRLGEAGRT
jgi:hypothetical protein